MAERASDRDGRQHEEVTLVHVGHSPPATQAVGATDHLYSAHSEEAEEDNPRKVADNRVGSNSVVDVRNDKARGETRDREKEDVSCSRDFRRLGSQSIASPSHRCLGFCFSPFSHQTPQETTKEK